MKIYRDQPIEMDLLLAGVLFAIYVKSNLKFEAGGYSCRCSWYPVATGTK